VAATGTERCPRGESGHREQGGTQDQATVLAVKTEKGR
jgi:hypothetical protein